MQDAAKLAAYTNRLIFGATQRKQFSPENILFPVFSHGFPLLFDKMADVGVTGGTNIILQW